MVTRCNIVFHEPCGWLDHAGPSCHCSITRHVMFVQSPNGELQGLMKYAHDPVDPLFLWVRRTFQLLNHPFVAWIRIFAADASLLMVCFFSFLRVNPNFTYSNFSIQVVWTCLNNTHFSCSKYQTIQNAERPRFMGTCHHHFMGCFHGGTPSSHP